MPRKWMTTEYKQHRANVLFEKINDSRHNEMVEAECKARENQDEINNLNCL